MERSLKEQAIGKTSVSQSIGMLLRRGEETFTCDAQAWGLLPRHALLIAALPVIATLAFLATAPFPALFRWVIDEDSLIEWFQFVFILAAGVMFARLSVLLIRDKRRGLGAIYLLLALGSLFVAGEEITWGQRIFGWRTPEALDEINAQRETSVHNIFWLHSPFVYAVMLGGLYGTVAPLVRLVFFGVRQRSELSFLFVPPLCLVPAFFVPFGYRFCRIVFQPELYYPRAIFIITEFSELAELCLYFGLLLFAWLNLRHLQQGNVG
jgi:hypothetical protein